MKLPACLQPPQGRDLSAAPTATRVRGTPSGLCSSEQSGPRGPRSSALRPRAAACLLFRVEGQQGRGCREAFSLQEEAGAAAASGNHLHTGPGAPSPASWGRGPGLTLFALCSRRAKDPEDTPGTVLWGVQAGWTEGVRGHWCVCVWGGVTRVPKPSSLSFQPACVSSQNGFPCGPTQAPSVSSEKPHRFKLT